jgi:hypothetical protein
LAQDFSVYNPPQKNTNEKPVDQLTPLLRKQEKFQVPRHKEVPHFSSHMYTDAEIIPPMNSRALLDFIYVKWKKHAGPFYRGAAILSISKR